MAAEVTAVIDEVAAKLGRGEALTGADVAALLQVRDLIALGMLADEARRRLNGDRVTFIRVLDVSPSGPVPEIRADTGEVRIVGLAPEAPESLDRIRAVAAAAGNIPVSACALEETSPGFLRGMKEAGAALVAEAAVDRLVGRDQIAAAAGAGLDVARWVVQSWEPLPPGDLLEHVRSLGPFRSFAPLPRVIDPAAPTTGYDDVKMVAVARLFLHDVRSISVDWSLYGPKLAQVALTFGADDLDGVPAETGQANLLGPRRAVLEEVKRNIRAASLTPVARDARYLTRPS